MGNNYNVPKLKFFLIFIVISSIFLDCDNRKEFKFPHVNVYLQLHIYTDLSDLGILNAKVYPNDGLGGVLIFKAEERKYFAFDMACTHEIPDVCAIEEYEKSSIIWECPCCKARYTLHGQGNYVSKGPAEWPLWNYNAYIDGDFLYVTD